MANPSYSSFGKICISKSSRNRFDDMQRQAVMEYLDLTTCHEPRARFKKSRTSYSDGYRI